MNYRIAVISEVFYRFDPADTSANRHNLTDEYDDEAAILLENYDNGLIKDKDDLSECVHDIMYEFFLIKLDYNADLINELYEVLNKNKKS